MSHETCDHCDKPLRLCACTADYDGSTYIGPTDCAFCGEELDDSEEGGPQIRDAHRMVDDLNTLAEWNKLDEGNQAVFEFITQCHYITLWPEGEVCCGKGNDKSPEGALHTAATWMRENSSAR